MTLRSFADSSTPRTRRLSVFSVVALVALTLAVGCSSTRPVTEQLDDAAISTTIKGKLAADPEINPFNIDVDTLEGRVRLSGRVDDDATRTEAEKHARKTKGVLSVDNDIRVGQSSVGGSLSDAAVSSKVKAKLAADPEINPFNVDVDVQDGVVTLSGRVATQAIVEEIVKVSSSVQGVERVENRLKVGDRKPE